MENQKSETGDQKPMEYSKTQTFLNKGKNNTKLKAFGGTIKLPKLASNNTLLGFKGTFYQSNQTYNPCNLYNSNNTYYDPNNLKQELSQNKNEINSKKLELQELKIRFNKYCNANKLIFIYNYNINYCLYFIY